MPNITSKNVLIRKHQEAKIPGYPMPDDYPNSIDFLMAHQQWLIGLRKENADATKKLMLGIRKETDSFVLQYLSGILHIRKEYGRFLTSGIQSCNMHILRGGTY